MNTTPVINIRDLRIGDIVLNPITKDQLFVVAVFADPGTLGFQPADKTGTIYCDFADNPGDVFEYDLSKDDLERVDNPNT